jgi:NTE family protein
MNDIAAFLASCPVFQGVPESDIVEMAPVFQVQHFPAGSLILKQGTPSAAIYFLRTGRLAVRIQRGQTRDTVAMLQPTDIFGELSFLTGKVVVADIEVVVDAEVVMVHKDKMPTDPVQRAAIQRGLLNAVAARLQDTVKRGSQARELPVVLLHALPNFAAPTAFPKALAQSFAEQTNRETMLITVSGAGSAEPVRVGEKLSTCSLDPGTGENDVRAALAQRLTQFKAYPNVFISVAGMNAAAIAAAIHDQTNHQGILAGPGDELPATPTTKTQFIVQAMEKPTLPFLAGNQQLIRDTAEAEEGKTSASFLRTAGSIARHIGGFQVGLALGGGAAWGWAHIGVLEELEKAGIPVDVLTGCSMGSVIGAFRSSGMSIEELKNIAEYWRTRTGRFIEWRLWRLCLIHEGKVRKTFQSYFGDRQVNQTDIPFWVNAVDIETGKEYSFRDGTLVDCMRASISLPGLIPPATKGDMQLVDAGIMSPVPAHQLKTMGASYAIGVNAMAAPGTTEMSARYPFNAFSVMIKCVFVMGHEIGNRAESDADVVFTPELAGINLLQFGRAPEIIQRGAEATVARISAIKSGYERLKSSMLGS